MKAVRIDAFVQDIDDLVVSDLVPPQCNDDEALVQVHAAGVNFVDILYARGKHQNNRRHVQPPFVLGLEFAGVVVAVASMTSSLRPGDRVYGSVSNSSSSSSSNCNGAFAEQIVVPAGNLHRLPAHWSFAQGASGVAVNLPVAYGALVQRAFLQPCDSVLVLGAAGGLGSMAIQVAARVVGCSTVIAVASNAAKCRVARACGATACVCVEEEEGDEEEEDGKKNGTWWEQVLHLTGGRGVDVVFDPVGAVQESLRCLADRGRILVAGFAARNEKTLEHVAMNRVLLKQASIIGYRYGESIRRYPKEHVEIIRAVEPFIRNSTIQPVLYDEFFYGLESVPRALKAVQDRKVWGKAIIIIKGDKAKI